MDTQLESIKKNIGVYSQKDNNRLSTEAFNYVSLLLETLSLAKNIKLMDGTLTVWERLVVQDLRAGNFEIEDFAEAVNIGIRKNMYNRIDYADIYQVANEKYKKRITSEREKEKAERLRRENGLRKTKMPEDMKEIIKNIKL
jgi:hypothetical protein